MVPAREVKSPHSLEAERAILGSILLDNEAIDLAAKTISADDFFSQANRLTWRKMLELRQAARLIDLVTLVDEFSQAAELEKVGGATYLASLTDGVPGGKSGVSQYARIVKDHSLRRQAITLANNLAARGFDGSEDVHAVIESLQQQVEELASRNGRGDVKAIEADVKKEEKPRIVYPDMPEEAWYGITKLYRSAVENTSQASNNYHLASFYAAFAAVMGRSAYTFMTQRIYPSLYVVFVGRAGGARKGTAIRYTIELATDIDPTIYEADQMDSRESFIREIGAVQAAASDPESQKSLRVILRLDELRKFLEKAQQKGVSNITTFLCELYDCPRHVQVLTGEKAKCKEPFLIMDAATSPSYLESLTSKEVEGGLGRRMLFIPGEPKPREGFDDPPQKDSEIYNSIKVRLREIVTEFRLRAQNGSVNVPMSAGARKLFKKWFNTQYNPPVDDEMISVLSEGDHVTVRQVGLLNALLDYGTPGFKDEISEEQLYAATRFVNWVYEARYPVFAGHGLTPMAKIDHRIIEFVKRQTNKHVMWKVLRNRMQRVCPDQKIFNERMRALTSDADSALKIKNLGNIRFVASND